MAESHREEESPKRARGDRLPWERRERLDRVRQRREGGSSLRRGSEHEKRSEGTEAREAASIETIKRRGEEVRGSLAD